MSIEIDVPLNSIVVGERYKFYLTGPLYKHGPDQFYATIVGFTTNIQYPGISISNVVDSVTGNNLNLGKLTFPVNMINRITSNNIGPKGTKLNSLVSSYLGGIRKRKRKTYNNNKKSKSKRKTKSKRKYRKGY
jgi:hypothetical protein